MGSAAETAARLAAGGRVHALAQRYRRPVARGLRALREEMPEALEAEKRDAVKFPSVRRTTSPRPRHNCGRIGAKTVPINGERGTITRLAANVRRELAENSPPVFMASFMAKVLTRQ